jgi:putative N6-adenine-specific DNA methylase
MDIFSLRSQIIITCHKRLAIYLEKEVQDLGLTVQETFATGVKLVGNMQDCLRLNLHLRCASQVLFSLQHFTANHADDVYKRLVIYPWENILPKGGYFSVTSNVQHPSINNSLFANLRVKDAIVDRLRNKTGERPQTGSALTGSVVHLFWKDDYAEVFIDTSGDSLARHGYRKIPGLAPMLEGLAAAAIYATQWNRQTPFINPMCGSGTLAIEAALMAMNKRPGHFRNNYAFMHLKGFDQSVYETERNRMMGLVTHTDLPVIIATDISIKAIDNARKNAKAAGVQDIITFKTCDFAETPVPQNEQGVMIVNPEYGERLGEQKELENTYSRIGDFMKQQCGGYYGYVFTGNLDLAKKIGLKAKRRIEFYNSTIDCRLLEYELYAGSRNTKKKIEE